MNDQSFNPELRKLLYSNLPEARDNFSSTINNEEDAAYYEDLNALAIGYFRAKQDFFNDAFNNQLKLETRENIMNGENLRMEDERMKAKLDFMYNYMDFDHDRAHARKKIMTEINKRTTLDDIGDQLDELVYKSKGDSYKYYDVAEDIYKEPESFKKDFTSEDFSWSGKYLK